MNKIIILIVGLMVVMSCNNRTDYFENENEIPEIKINNQVYFKDTIKGLKVYETTYYAYDKQPGSITCNYFKGNGTVNVNYEDSVIQVEPYEYGEHKISVEYTDIYGGANVAEMELYVFENYIPVVGLEFYNEGNRMYKIDASGSYDQDNSYGGEIVKYQFKVKTDYEVTTVLPYIYYQFNTNGSFQIQVRAKDNDGHWSEWLSKNLDVSGT